MDRARVGCEVAVRRPRRCDGSFILRSSESRCSGPVSASLAWPGRSCASFGDAIHTPGDAHGVRRSFAVLLRPRGSANDGSTQPTCRSSPHHPDGFVRGAAGMFQRGCSRPAEVRATRLLGFPAGQPYPADASTGPLLPWTWGPLPGLRTPVLSLLGQQAWRGERARMPARPSALGRRLHGRRTHPLLGLGASVTRPPFSVLQGRCLVHPEQPSRGKELSRSAARHRRQ